MITPGIHSASNSFDEANTLRARGIALPAKWRQKGNEWISLDLDQPTPVGTPPSPLPPPGTNELRTPRKLTSDVPFAQARAVEVARGAPRAVISPRTQRSGEVLTPTSFPGTYPPTPQEVNQNAVQQNTGADHTIRRKPVGATPTKMTQDTDRLSPEPALSPLELRPTLVNAEQSARSSSAPTSRKTQPFSPADVGKDLPVIPDEYVLPSRRNEDPFLDHRPDVQARVHSSGTLNTSGRFHREKGLPCLPTSNGQYQSMNPEPYASTLAEGPLPMPQLSRPQGPRGNDQIDPHFYKRKPRQMLTSMQETPRPHPRGGRPMPIPVYDNPPAPPMYVDPLAMQHPDVIPRRVYPRCMHAQGPREGPFTTISTSTSMFTDMPPPPARFPRMRPRMHAIQRGSGEMGMIDPFVNQRPQPNVNMKGNIHSEDLMTVPMPRVRPRAAFRPQMPSRAEGMHSVPKVNMSQTSSQGVLMVAPLQSSLTGMQTTSHISDDVEDHTFPVHTFGPPNLRIITPNFAGESSEPADLHGLTRRCSRCSNGFVTGRPRNTNQVVTPADRLMDGTILTTLDEKGQEVSMTNVRKNKSYSPHSEAAGISDACRAPKRLRECR